MFFPKLYKRCKIFTNRFMLNVVILTIILEVSAVTKMKTPNRFEASILPERYVKEMKPPTPKGQPMTVDFRMKVVDINSINVEDMDFRMDMFLTQEWSDPRLQVSDDLFEDGDEYVSLPTQYFDNFWQPDLYFLNSKITGALFYQLYRKIAEFPALPGLFLTPAPRGVLPSQYFSQECKIIFVAEIATLTYQYSSVTLFRNKTIRYAARMHAIVACQMEFQYYPMDIQHCPLSIESFTYTSDKMILSWSGSGVSVSPELKLLQYAIGTELKLEHKIIYVPEKFGNFSRLMANFSFERQIGHHLIQTFAPSTLIVVLSWFSFWLGLDAIPGRVTLLITCMLTLVTMFTGLRSDIPPVAYVKVRALDLWMAGCMVFVFAAIGEFVIVKVLHEHYNTAMEHNDVKQVLPMVKKYGAWHNGNFGGNSDGTVITWAATSLANNYRGENKKKFVPKWGNLTLAWTDEKTGKLRILWYRIDQFSRVLFPSMFLIFLTFFWPLLIYRNQ